jgi:hypothetical protein
LPGPPSLLLVVFAVVAWNVHGDNRYNAGIEQEKKDQADADAKAKADREQEKAHDEQEAQRKIDLARNDAMLAAQRLAARQQLDSIRSKLRQYANTVGAGPSAADTGILTDVFSKSLERNRQLAEYADRAEAGRLCERQYDSLKKAAVSR